MKKITIKKTLIGIGLTILGLGILKFNKEKTEMVIETSSLNDTLLIDSFPLDTLNSDTLFIDTTKLDTI